MVCDRTALEFKQWGVVPVIADSAGGTVILAPQCSLGGRDIELDPRVDHLEC